MHNRLALFHAQSVEHFFQTLRAENPHQIIIQRQEKGAATRIPLPARSTTQLVINAARLVPFGGQNIKPASIFDRLLIAGVLFFDPAANIIWVRLRVRRNGLHNGELNIAAQFDVRTPPGHIGRNRYCTQLTCIGNDFGLLLMLARVQNIVRDASSGQQF